MVSRLLLTLIFLQDAHLVPVPNSFEELNSPNLIRAKEHESLPDEEIVFGINRKGEQCAYPLRALAAHRVINDNLGGPMLIVYDAHTGAVRAYEGTLNDRKTTFNFHGWLGGSTILVDPESSGLWSALTGTALSGSDKGKSLTPIAVTKTTWKIWKLRHQNSWIPDIDYLKKYPRRPESEILKLTKDATESLGKADSRLKGDTRVIAFQLDKTQYVIPKPNHLGAFAIKAGDDDLLLVSTKSEGVLLVRNTLDGKLLELDTKTTGNDRTWLSHGSIPNLSIFNLEGSCTEGPYRTRRIEVIPSVETVWFAWSALSPDSTLMDPID